MLFRYDIALAAWHQHLASVAQQNLGKIGFVDDAGIFLGISYPASGQMDLLLERLRAEYATEIMKSMNIQSAALALGISEREALITVLHEVAYCLLERLETGGYLRYPEALRKNTGASRMLASLRLDKVPTKADHAVAAFIRRGGRGNNETIDAIRDALSLDPTNGTLLMYLGLSQYEVFEYRPGP